MERRRRLDGALLDWRPVSPADARFLIAETILGAPSAGLRLGSVTLHPHQLSAVRRLRAAIDQFNGALLCDDVGMGKTYVALAIAREFARSLVVMPAALVSMWRGALGAAGIDAPLVSFEALSRADIAGSGDNSPPKYDLVIIDEAHHARNQRTNRYLALESLVRGARVLLLTATPIHNRRDDLVALLALFLGSRARALTSSELGLCVVRRQQNQLPQPLGIPSVQPTIFHDIPDEPALVERLMTLPPPLPAREGGIGGALIGRGLVHQLASSEAALRDAVRRRIARATALCSALEAGTYPTASELETWIFADGALQLAFAELLSAPIVGHKELLTTIRAHLTALERLGTELASAGRADEERGRTISSIRRENPGVRIAAFTQYSATASMLFRKLASTGRVALLTSHGARVAGGSLTRSEAINRFAPLASGVRRPAAAEVIDLLLTTDLLSEGVNLQDAGIIVHVDLPWTAARLEQRVGRAARLGSPHRSIVVHALRPPPSAAELLQSGTIVEQKWSVARQVVGTSAPMPRFLPTGQLAAIGQPGESTPENTERLRILLETWLRSGGNSSAHNGGDSTSVATVIGADSGFVAAISTPGGPRLLAAFGDRVASDLPTLIARCDDIDGAETPSDKARVSRVVELIYDWRDRQSAAESAGLGASAAQARKELTNRIDALVETAPLHLRASRVATASRARRVATTTQCAAVERKLEELLGSGLDPDAWLAAVADLDLRQAPDNLPLLPGEDLTIHAILIAR